MITHNLQRYHTRVSHRMCALKHGSIKLIAHCVHASLHIFTMHYEFPYTEAQDQISVKNSDSCPFPNVKHVFCNNAPLSFTYQLFTVKYGYSGLLILNKLWKCGPLLNFLIRAQ